jgi:protein gp37
MKRSSIAWTDFSSGDLNFCTGCTAISEACRHCYARRIYERFGKDFSKVTMHGDKLERLETAKFPQDGNKRGPNSKPMCFVCDTGDLFHDAVSFEFVETALYTMKRRWDVTWQILTKRPERMFNDVIEWMCGDALEEVPGNIWLGVTAENQARADERIPLLLQTPAAVRFVSCEPLLGPLDLSRYLNNIYKTAGKWELYSATGTPEYLSWVIAGGESGPDARPMNLDWARSLRDQCKAAHVAYFFKQSGGPRPGMGETLDGETYHEWPEVGA